MCYLYYSGTGAHLQAGTQKPSPLGKVPPQGAEEVFIEWLGAFIEAKARSMAKRDLFRLVASLRST